MCMFGCLAVWLLVAMKWVGLTDWLGWIGLDIGYWIMNK